MPSSTPAAPPARRRQPRRPRPSGSAGSRPARRGRSASRPGGRRPPPTPRARRHRRGSPSSRRLRRAEADEVAHLRRGGPLGSLLETDEQRARCRAAASQRPPPDEPSECQSTAVGVRPEVRIAWDTSRELLQRAGNRDRSARPARSGCSRSASSATRPSVPKAPQYRRARSNPATFLITRPPERATTPSPVTIGRPDDEVPQGPVGEAPRSGVVRREDAARPSHPRRQRAGRRRATGRAGRARPGGWQDVVPARTTATPSSGS